MTLKAMVTLAAIGAATSVSAQSTLSLDDFDLSPSTSTNPSASSSLDLDIETQPASEMEACLLDQSKCANAEYRTTDSISLDDVVNLGIVDHQETPPSTTPSSIAASSNTAAATSTTVAQPKPITKSLPTIDIEILFDSGKDNVRYDQEPKLRELAGILASDRFNGYRFLFLGHTDAKGNEDFNWTLSQRRAESVAQVVRIYTGLPPERVLASGMGETRLKDPNYPLAGFNRRVQLVLLPQ